MPIFCTATFRPEPYWWEAYRPAADELAEVPKAARVAIVGGGYAGLSTALELAKQGIDAVVLEAGALGFGASTRNGGAVSGGVNVGKSFTGKTIAVDERAGRGIAVGCRRRLCADRSADRAKNGSIASGKSAAGLSAPGRGRISRHSSSGSNLLNAAAQSGAYMVPREHQRGEIASDYYYGGMVVERSGKLHPALYYKGLLDACRRREIAICAKAAVGRITRAGDRLAGRDPARRAQRRRCRDRHQRLYRRSDARR